MHVDRRLRGGQVVLNMNPAELLTDWRRELIDVVAGHLHEGYVIEAAREICSRSGIPKPKSVEVARETCWTLIGTLLGEYRYADAATLLWPRTVFSPGSWATRTVWEEIHNNASTMLMGAASMSKTFSAGVYFLLDWLADPEFTTVRVVGPTQTHLQDNLFSHLVDMHTRASLPMPGIVGDLFIGSSRRNRRAGITGVIIPIGKSAAGRLQGVKRFPRTKPHPVYGPMSRLRVLMDEVEHVPVGVWSDIENLAANVDSYGGLRIAVAFNPKNPGGPCGIRSEPPEGWGNYDENGDKYLWDSKRGWRVVRLDAERSENVKTGRVIYPGLQTREGLEKLERESGGRESAGFRTFGRALFPKEGGSFSVIPPSNVQGIRGDYIWADKPRRLAACDLALEGGDKSLFIVGLFGRARGFKSGGRETFFLNSRGDNVERTVIWAEAMRALPRGNSVRMSEQVRSVCTQLGVAPGWLMLDRTGHGQGVYDILRDSWSPEVMGVNYSESASESKILFEDSEDCFSRFDRAQSELWFALKAWLEFDLIKVGPDIPLDPLVPQLTGRLYDPKLRAKVESKRDYKKRLSVGSPDEADGMTLLVHCARRAAGVVPAGLLDNIGEQDGGDEGPMDFLVDQTNLVDGID